MVDENQVSLKENTLVGLSELLLHLLLIHVAGRVSHTDHLATMNTRDVLPPPL